MNTAHTLLRSWRFHAPGGQPGCQVQMDVATLPPRLLSSASSQPTWLYLAQHLQRPNTTTMLPSSTANRSRRYHSPGALRQQAAVFQPHMRPSACTVEIHTAHFAHRPPRDRHLATELPHVSHRAGTVDTEPEKPPSRLRTSEALKYAPVPYSAALSRPPCFSMCRRGLPDGLSTALAPAQSQVLYSARMCFLFTTPEPEETSSTEPGQELFQPHVVHTAHLLQAALD